MLSPGISSNLNSMDEGVAPVPLLTEKNGLVWWWNVVLAIWEEAPAPPWEASTLGLAAKTTPTMGRVPRNGTKGEEPGLCSFFCFKLPAGMHCPQPIKLRMQPEVVQFLMDGRPGLLEQFAFVQFILSRVLFLAGKKIQF